MKEMPGPSTFGEVLRRYRLAAGLTQEALAERAGLSVRAITDLERGINRSPRQETFARLAAALDLSPADQVLWDAARRRSRGPGSQQPGARVAAENVPLFVGREQELRLLEFHLTASGAPLLLLAGEPGIGKSRLLCETLPAAAANGLSVLTGGCTQRDGQEPYAPIAPALARFLREVAPERARMVLRGCAWMVRLLPELSQGPVEPLLVTGLPAEQERRLMFEAVVRFLRNVAGPRGTLLLLDDLQWAGEDALNLLRALAHAAGESGLRIVGAYRDTEVGPQSPLSLMLADLAQAGLAQQRQIGPLAPHAAHRLVHSLLHAADKVLAHEHPNAIVDLLLQRANGVPFFLVSCAQSVRARFLQDGTAGELPWTVVQSIRQRVAALPDATRELLSTAATAGRDVSRATLAAATCTCEEEVLAAIEPACHARLLEEAGVDGYRFSHDVIREVVAGDLGTGRRALLHRRIADVLAEHSAPPLEAIAYHYREAGAWASALLYLLQAGDRAAHSYAYTEALELYSQADAVCAHLGEGALPTALMIAQKRAAINFFNRMALGHARADYDRVAALARQLGDRRQEGMAVVHHGLVAWMDHAFAEAEAAYRTALTISGPGTEEVHLAASLSLAHLCQSLNRHDEARELFQEAAAWSEVVDDPFIQVMDGHFRAGPAIWGGHFDKALAILARSQVDVDRVGQEIFRLQQTWLEALAYAAKGAYEEALALLEQMLAAGERCGDVLWKGRCLNTMGWVYAELQDHPRALELNTLALEATRELTIPKPEVENNTRLNLGDILVALGRLDEAAVQYELVQRVVEHPTTEEQWMLWRYAQRFFHSFGELQLLRGDHDTALASADACLRLAEQSASRKNIVKARRLRGQVFAAQGQLAQAEQELATALKLAEEVGNPPQLWKTYVAIGELRRVEGRMADQVAAYRAAMKVIEGIASDLRDRSRRANLLGSPHVAAIRRYAGND